MELNKEFSFIDGYEGLYKVSRDGRVISVKTGKELKQSNDKYGYLQVTLSRSGKRKTFKVHRLVANAFLPNPSNYKFINHKDEIKKNNNFNNLEWCSPSYNINYRQGNIRRAYKLKIPVVLSKDRIRVVFESTNDAAEWLMVKPNSITNCLRKYGGKKRIRGYEATYQRGFGRCNNETG